MSSNTNSRFSIAFLKVTLLLVCVLIVWSGIYLIWSLHNNYRLNHYGQHTVATVIRKDGGMIEYDVEYEGNYYRNWILLSKSAFRIVQVGERFEGLILPDKLKYDHENGITPRYIKIVLRPLPASFQDIEQEQERIRLMYHYD